MKSLAPGESSGVHRATDGCEIRLASMSRGSWVFYAPYPDSTHLILTSLGRETWAKFGLIISM